MLTIMLISLALFVVFGTISVDKKAGSFAEFSADVKAMGKIVLTEALRLKVKTEADVSGQKGHRLYRVKGKDRTWLVGADVIAKAMLKDSLDLTGNDTLKVKIDGKADKVMTDVAFESTPLCHAIVDAMARQKAKASDKA